MSKLDPISLLSEPLLQKVSDYFVRFKLASNILFLCSNKVVGPEDNFKSCSSLEVCRTSVSPNNPDHDSTNKIVRVSFLMYQWDTSITELIKQIIMRLMRYF